MNDQRRRRWPDAVLTALCLTAGLWIGTRYTSLPQVISEAAFYQGSMAPAVMFACGRGLTNIERSDYTAEEVAPLLAFLELRRDRIDCSEVPVVRNRAPFGSLQSASRYLILSIGMAWRATEISWSGLSWFCGVIFGVVGALSYRIARAMLGRPLSLIVTALLLTSPAQLDNLAHLRDYSKVPFFLGMFLMLLQVVVRPVPARTLVGWSAAAGALTGIAFGVRFDALVFLWFFIGAVLVFTPGSIRQNWRPRLAAAAAALAAFVVVALPILLAFQLGNNSWHVVILGLSDAHEEFLDLRRSYYQLGAIYNDSYVSAVINAFWQRRHGAGPLLLLDEPAYAQAGFEYFLQVARTFPADLLLRVWAGLLQLSRMAFDYWGPPPEAVPTDGLIFRIAVLRTAGVAWVGSAIPGITLLPLVVPIALAAFSLRLSLLAITAWIFFGAMSSLQFQTRHVVHLELVSLLFTALAVVGATRAARAVFEYRPHRRSAYVRGALTVAAVAALTAVVVVAPLHAMRLVQAPRVRAQFTEYERHLGPPLPIASMVAHHGTRLIAPVEKPDLPPPLTLRRQFYAAGLGGPGCDFEELIATVRYESSSPSYDLSHPLAIRTPLTGTLTHAWFVTYDLQGADGHYWYRFAGLEVPAHLAPCVVSLARADTQQDLLVNATLPPHWEHGRLYSILNRWEPNPEPPFPTTYTFPPDKRVRITELQRRFAPLERATDYVHRNAWLGPDGRVAVDGSPASVTYLVSWLPVSTSGKTLLLAEGDLMSGGLAIGLERNGEWVGQVVVIRPGPFRAVIEVPQGTDVRPVIANNRPGAWSTRTRFQIDRIGWIQ